MQALTKVRKVLVDNSNDLSLDELLTKADVSLDQYVSALEVSTKGSMVILKRKPIECNINNYNAPVMQPGKPTWISSMSSMPMPVSCMLPPT